MSLGSLIAKARKDAGLSLEDLAAKTNIRINVLSEIEQDDFSIVAVKPMPVAMFEISPQF